MVCRHRETTPLISNRHRSPFKRCSVGEVARCHLPPEQARRARGYRDGNKVSRFHGRLRRGGKLVRHRVQRWNGPIPQRNGRRTGPRIFAFVDACGTRLRPGAPFQDLIDWARVSASVRAEYHFGRVLRVRQAGLLGAWI